MMIRRSLLAATFALAALPALAQATGAPLSATTMGAPATTTTTAPVAVQAVGTRKAQITADAPVPQPATTVRFPADLAPYVYKVAASGRNHYLVTVKTGFVGAKAAAEAIAPLCQARQAQTVGHDPARIQMGRIADAPVTALTYHVNCR